MNEPDLGRTAAHAGSTRVCGLRLAFRHHPGAEGRIPLLLCGGIGSSMHLLDSLIAELDPHRPIVRFDVPGIGESPSPLLPYTYHQLAFGTRALLDELGYREGAHVLGFSWGGGLAQQLAFQNPRYCRRVVLVATATGACMVPAAPRTLVRMLTPRRHRDPDYARHVAAQLYGGEARRDPDRTVRALHSAPTATPIRGYLYQLAAIAGWSSLMWLPLIRQPTLLVAGDDDPIIRPVNASIMNALLPRGRVHSYPGGHLTLLTSPEALAPVIEQFLDSSSPHVGH